MSESVFATPSDPSDFWSLADGPFVSLSPFERATGGYSISSVELPSGAHDWALVDPLGVVVTNDLSTIIAVLLRNHPRARQIRAAEQALAAVQVASVLDRVQKIQSQRPQPTTTTQEK